MSQFGTIEVVNRSVNSVFSNTNENDLVFYTSTSNQALHLGTQSNLMSTLVITPSNMQINGDLSLLNRRVNFSRLTVNKPSAIGTPTNITSVVGNNTAQIAPQNGSNYDFMLSNANTQYRFLDSNGVTEATITNTGKILMNSNDSSNAPAYSWNGDASTGVYRARANVIGIAAGGSNTLTVSPSNVNINTYLTQANIPAFHAFNLTQAMSITTTPTTTIMGSTTINRFNAYNTTTGVYTVPVTGLYTFHLRLMAQHTGNGTNLYTIGRLVVNNNGVAESSASSTSTTAAGTYDTVNLHWIGVLNQGDTIQPVVFGDKTTGAIILEQGGRSAFMGYMIA